MKRRILLGLAAMSLLGAVSYGASGPDVNGLSTIDITTNAEIIGYGIVISSTSTGADPTNDDVTLNHDAVYAPDSSYNSTSNLVTRYLRRNDQQDMPSGQVVNIELLSDVTNGNNLVSGANTIPQVLSATMESSAFTATGSTTVGGVGGVLAVSDSTTTDSLTYTVGAAGIAYIPFDFQSTIAAGGYYDVGGGVSKPAGTYTNVSSFTAQISQ